MFMKLASGVISLIFGAAGFMSMFILNLVGRRGWLSALTGAFFGALGFTAAWFLIIMVLTVLFSEEELQNIFFGRKKTQSKAPQQEAPSFDTAKYDDGDELTAEELYSPSKIDIPEIFTGLDGQPLNRPASSSSSNKSVSGLDAAGGFDFQTGDRVLRTNAKEAALAARKVLMNDQK